MLRCWWGEDSRSGMSTGLAAGDVMDAPPFCSMAGPDYDSGPHRPLNPCKPGESSCQSGGMTPAAAVQWHQAFHFSSFRPASISPSHLMRPSPRRLSAATLESTCLSPALSSHSLRDKSVLSHPQPSFKNFQHTPSDLTMARRSLSKVTSLVARSLRSSPSHVSRSSLLTNIGARRTITRPISSSLWRTLPTSRQFFSTTQSQDKGILPDSDDPAPPNVQTSNMKAAPAALSDQDYHELADEYLGVIQDRLEEVAEHNEQIDVLYEVCTLHR